MEKRLVAAILVSVVIIVLYPVLVARMSRGHKETVVPGRSVSQPLDNKRVTIIHEEQMAKADLRSLETDKLRVILSNAGGCIKGIYLRDYRDTATGEGLKLVDAEDSPEGVFSVLAIGEIEGVNENIYEVVEEDGKLTYAYDSPGGIRIAKNFKFKPEAHSAELELEITNRTAIPKKISFDVVAGWRINEGTSLNGRSVEIVSRVNGNVIHDSGGKIRKDEVIHTGAVSWVGIKNKYFCVVLIPEEEVSHTFARRVAGTSLQSGLRFISETISGNSSVKRRFTLYAGPNKEAELSTYGKNLEKVVDYGVFGGISKLMLRLLTFFHSVVHNYGIGIILLSVLVGIVLSPLSMKGMHSMKEMQEKTRMIQPQIQKIKQQYKDNPQKMNAETMHLYKKYRINPLGGCLPSLLQMPVFIALWQAISKSVELWGARFLWIKDLSSEDRLFVLPFSLPGIGDAVNLLPILMTVGMVVQQKMSSTVSPGQDERQQKNTALFMAVVFGAVFYRFPSGLVLYWLVNTAITVILNLYVIKRWNPVALPP
jgi:YidC/Oxa1 family membrane protein insertase